MPKEIYKILGQVAPVAATETDLYSTQEKRSTICKVRAYNRGAGNANISIAVVPDGAGSGAPGTSNENFLIENFVLTPKTEYIEKGITMNEFDEIRVESDTADCTFQCYGVEIEP